MTFSLHKSGRVSKLSDRGAVEPSGAGRRQVGSHALHRHDVGVVGSQAAATGDVHAACKQQSKKWMHLNKTTEEKEEGSIEQTRRTRRGRGRRRRGT
jgi:hypothetical protein